MSVTISNGPYINLPVKVWGPSSLAMVSFILWLAVTFCTSQEGKRNTNQQRKRSAVMDSLTGKGQIQPDKLECLSPSITLTALSFREESDLWQRGCSLPSTDGVDLRVHG